MRIGVYFGDYRPDLGGGYTHVAELLEGFVAHVGRSTHDYIVMCEPAAMESVAKRIRAPNVTVVRVPVLSRRLWLTGLWYFSPLLRSLLRWRRSAVERVAAKNGVQLLWFVGVGAHVPPDIPYIANVWDLQHRLRPFFPEVSAGGIWDKREQFYSHFLRRATYCVTGAAANKDTIAELYGVPAWRVRVLPLPTPGFALGAQPSQLDVRSKFNIDRPYVFYPAQLWPHKNHANLILALQWLRQERGLDLALVLCGSNKGNLSYIKSLSAQNGMADQVHYLGFISTEEMVALYRGAVAVPFVSYFGPDNLPPLEALALGCPVIASDMPGASEQYGNAAILVDASSPSDIGQAIYNVYSDAVLRDSLKQAGIVRARSWTSADCVAAMFELFNEFSKTRRTWA